MSNIMTNDEIIYDNARRVVEDVLNNHDLRDVATYMADYEDLVDDLTKLLLEGR